MWWGCPERPARDECPVTLSARAVDLGHLDALLHGERRENARHPARQHGLPGARRPTHDDDLRTFKPLSVRITGLAALPIRNTRSSTDDASSIHSHRYLCTSTTCGESSYALAKLTAYLTVYSCSIVWR